MKPSRISRTAAGDTPMDSPPGVEALRLADRITLAVEVGESHFREFKSGLHGAPGSKTARDLAEMAKDVGDTLVGFANADGGDLWLGIEDDGELTGLKYTEVQIQSLLDAVQSRVHKDTPLPSTRATTFTYEGKRFVYYAVPKGTRFKHLTSDGRCLQRQDRETVPVASEKIDFSRNEIESRQYDRVFVDGATLADIDIRLVAKVADQISKGMSPEKCLQHLELAEHDGASLRMRRAALLLFARAPSKWHPRLQVRILKIAGTEIRSGERYNVTLDEFVSGTVFTLIESSWELLRPHLTETKFSSEAMFKTQIAYPEQACREAIINAIAHRDYSAEGIGVEVHLYTDRMEIISPGPLLSSIRVEDLRALKGAHQSRNALTARVLREVGYMRELGEGMRRIFAAMHYNDLAPPDLTSAATNFRITLHQKHNYPNEVKLWLDSFESWELSRDEKAVVRLGYNGRRISAQDIWDSLGIVDTEEYRKVVESLQKKGILDKTMSEAAVNSLARRQRVSRKQIPKYVVKLPGANEPPPLWQTSKAPEGYFEVFVVGLPWGFTRAQVEDAFGAFGEVVNVHIPTNPQTGLDRGYLFLEFGSAKAAQTAVEASGSIFVKGKAVTVQPPRPKAR